MPPSSITNLMAETDAERQAREAGERVNKEARRCQAEFDRGMALDAYEAKYAAVDATATPSSTSRSSCPWLDRAADNYNRRRSMSLVVLGKYALTNHVLSDIVNDDRPMWVQMNCTVLTWMYYTIQANLQ